MALDSARTAIRAAVDAVKKQLGGELRAAYLYGSLVAGYYQPDESNINLLFLVPDDVDIHALRKCFLPVWAEHGSMLRRGPMLLTDSAWVRHRRLHPGFVHHLAAHGRRLAGDDIVGTVLFPKPVARFAAVSHEALQLSSLLAGRLLSTEVAAERHIRLRRLARQLARQPMPDNATVPDLIAFIQMRLASMERQLTDIKPDTFETFADTPPLIPGLQAIYERTDDLILLTDTLTPERVRSIAWSKVVKQIEQEYGGVQVATLTQFRLAASWDFPVAVALRHYSHAWGQDPLQQLDIPTTRLLESAARHTATLTVDELPALYLTARDNDVRMLVHDLQNKLMNIGLQHELLHRLLKIERAAPPDPLPDRATHPTIRIAAIWSHLDWWSNHYALAMDGVR